MLGRQIVVDHGRGEYLTSCAIGRDGLGCTRTASQLRSSQHSLARACHSSHRVAATAAPTAVTTNGECHALPSECSVIFGNKAVRSQPGPSRARAQGVSCSPPSWSSAVGLDQACCPPRDAAVADCSSLRRVPRSSKQTLSAPELEGGPCAAMAASANGTGRLPLSSIVESNTPSIEHAVHRSPTNEQRMYELCSNGLCL